MADSIRSQDGVSKRFAFARNSAQLMEYYAVHGRRAKGCGKGMAPPGLDCKSDVCA
jgi:hypothetical protein